MSEFSPSTTSRDAPAEPDSARFSLLSLSAGERLIGAAAVSAVLWLGVLWALSR
jgi:hypothetical protein